MTHRTATVRVPLRHFAPMALRIESAGCQLCNGELKRQGRFDTSQREWSP